MMFVNHTWSFEDLMDNFLKNNPSQHGSSVTYSQSAEL